MKKKVYVTTEFYKKPSEALNFVKDGGTVYLGYKNLKDPIAVITPYKEYVSLCKKKNTQSFIQRFGGKAVSAPELKDGVKYIREQRRKK
jgi:hypothetical protein